MGRNLKDFSLIKEAMLNVTNSENNRDFIERLEAFVAFANTLDGEESLRVILCKKTLTDTHIVKTLSPCVRKLGAHYVVQELREIQDGAIRESVMRALASSLKGVALPDDMKDSDVEGNE